MTRRPGRRNDFLARLYAKIAPADPATGCRLWLGGRTPDGYGRFSVGHGKGTAAPAHVIVWEVERREPWPAGKHADHDVCFQHGCVEPAHVHPKDPEDNYGWRAGCTGYRRNSRAS